MWEWWADSMSHGEGTGLDNPNCLGPTCGSTTVHVLFIISSNHVLTIVTEKCEIMHVCMLSHFSYAQLFVAQWTVVHQALLSMGFSRQEYWSRLPCPLPGYLPNPGIKPASLGVPALTRRFFTNNTTWKILKL